MTYRTEYGCNECDWSIIAREGAEEDAAQFAIQHYVESGHSVGREDDPAVSPRRPLWPMRW